MAVIHVKSNTVADFTGTVTVYNGSGATVTANATDLVRPSDWNSAHSQVFTLSGNTAGNSTVGGLDVVLQGGPNVTLSGNGSTVVISAGAGGGGGGVAVSAGANSQSTGTVVFSNSNGVTFGLNAGTLTASHNGITSQSVQTQSNVQGISAGTTVARTGDVVFSNSNGVTFGLNGNTVTASHNGLTSQSNQAFSAGGGSSAFQTLNFVNSNGVTFTNTNGSVGASVATTYRASNDAVGLNTAQTNVTWTVNSGGISLNAGGYAGTGTSATNASITLNSNGLAISVAAPGGGGAINVSAGTTSGNLQTVVFSNSNNVTFGLDGSTVTASVAAAGGRTRSGFNPYPGNVFAAQANQQGSMVFYPHPGMPDVQIDRAIFLANFTNATNSSGSLTATIGFGFYTKNGGTLSVVYSTSQTYALTMSGTVGSYSLYSGIRAYSIPWTTTISAGDYVVGVNVRTTTGGANMTFQPMCVSQLNSGINGDFGEANLASRMIVPGLGIAGVSTAGVLGSLAFSDMVGTASANIRPPVFFLTSGTA